MEVLGCVVRFFPSSYGRGCGGLLGEKQGDQVMFFFLILVGSVLLFF